MNILQTVCSAVGKASGNNILSYLTVNGEASLL